MRRISSSVLGFGAVTILCQHVNIEEGKTPGERIVDADSGIAEGNSPNQYQALVRQLALLKKPALRVTLSKLQSETERLKLLKAQFEESVDTMMTVRRELKDILLRADEMAGDRRVAILKRIHEKRAQSRLNDILLREEPEKRREEGAQDR